MQSVIIERPKSSHLIEIDQLYALTVRDNFEREGIDDLSGEKLAKEIESVQMILRTDFESQRSSVFHLIARLDQQIIGTIGYGKPNAIIRKKLGAAIKSDPEIKSAYILPGYQRRGLGTLLFHAIKEELRTQNISHYYLDCGYRISQGFWLNQIGEPIHILRDYWGEDQNHLIWHQKV